MCNYDKAGMADSWGRQRHCATTQILQHHDKSVVDTTDSSKAVQGQRVKNTLHSLTNLCAHSSNMFYHCFSYTFMFKINMLNLVSSVKWLVFLVAHWWRVYIPLLTPHSTAADQQALNHGSIENNQQVLREDEPTLVSSGGRASVGLSTPYVLIHVRLAQMWTLSLLHSPWPHIVYFNFCCV